ncbi:MAG: XRE family transcriptional regulator [Lachnospiraceae bacterium]|nr:XRE family transcriptional regulator [Lachnospiraceae bacterium]
MNTIGPILAKYRKRKHLTQPELALLLQKEGIDVTEKGVSCWESGRTEPGYKQIFTLCKILEIKDIYEEIFGVNPYNRLSLLNEVGKERANEYIDMLVSKDKYLKHDLLTSTSDQIRELRLYNLRVSAGTGNILDSDDYELITADEFVPPAADFAVQITGDSMTPLIKDGQIVYVHSQDTLEDGEIGIFSLDGNVYCKKLLKKKKGSFLLSLNKRYEPIPITETSNLHIFGKIV